MVYPRITGGASLLVALPLVSKTTLIIGDGTLAATRATAALQADSKVIVVASSLSEVSSDEIRARGENGELLIVEGPIEDVLAAHGTNIMVAFITDTLIGAPKRRDLASATALRDTLKKWNILVNVADIPSLCDFTLPACHRFTLASSPPNSSQTPSSLQVAVTTNGKGCRLAGRIRREIVSRLPDAIGNAVENVSRLADMAKASVEAVNNNKESALASSQLHEDSLPLTPNEPVEQTIGVYESKEAAQKRRMRWVAQISEYWPLEHLAKLDVAQSEQILRQSFGESAACSPNGDIQGQTIITQTSISSSTGPSSQHDLALSSTTHFGQIYLLGSGPGHPDLLTVAAYNILTCRATLVLSDKLVPSEVLELIPSTTRVKIAKKFPGNNEDAQNELMVEAVDAAQRGEIVIRLKQGDPMIYGRAGDEILYFRKHGFEPIVIPGVTSAIAGPTFAGIPVTQRGVADSMILCTGVGRQGKPSRLPGYIRSRTLVLLMGVARLGSLLKTLLDKDVDPSLREGEAYPANLPIAIIERASMPDQRVISATLETISTAMAKIGEQRPPGMIVVGWSVLALYGSGDIKVLDDAKLLSESASDLHAADQARIERWLRGEGWRVTERFNKWT
ncbi:hypothetical protein M408DRAFT_327360 [Serendipita vermifera MAFF 305830]|uniref:precorrin-2 dehydrogenase n=1 Tax=Serendipita vermifera MAFF 305830 TaxID=933852 RepID=A0A0C2X132_SERVB|nr:hypothetical protein M408DRAFT_327360 [Serendipita vermifera MAFF 305830]